MWIHVETNTTTTRFAPIVTRWVASQTPLGRAVGAFRARMYCPVTPSTMKRSHSIMVTSNDQPGAQTSALDTRPFRGWITDC